MRDYFDSQGLPFDNFDQKIGLRYDDGDWQLPTAATASDDPGDVVQVDAQAVEGTDEREAREGIDRHTYTQTSARTDRDFAVTMRAMVSMYLEIKAHDYERTAA